MGAEEGLACCTILHFSGLWFLWCITICFAGCADLNLWLGYLFIYNLRQECIPATFKLCLCGDERTVFSDDRLWSSTGLSNSTLRRMLENIFIHKPNNKSLFYKRYEDLKFFGSYICRLLLLSCHSGKM